MAATLRATVMGILLASSLAPLLVLATWELAPVHDASAPGDHTVPLAFVGVMLFVVLGAVLLSVVLSTRVVGPIRELERAAATAEGDAPLELPPERGAREVRSLRASLARMSQ